MARMMLDVVDEEVGDGSGWGTGLDPSSGGGLDGSDWGFGLARGSGDLDGSGWGKGPVDDPPFPPSRHEDLRSGALNSAGSAKMAA